MSIPQKINFGSPLFQQRVPARFQTSSWTQSNKRRENVKRPKRAASTLGEPWCLISTGARRRKGGERISNTRWAAQA